MARNNFEKLIERYAGNKQICNCGDAYYKNCGHALINGKEVFDNPTCEHGCSANQISARRYIADKVVAELENTSK